MHRNTRRHNNAHKFSYLQNAIFFYIPTSVTHTHTHLTSSSYWKNSRANQLPLSQIHNTRTAQTSYCALNGSRMLRNCLPCLLAMVFVWFHAYCAVIEQSDRSTKGGLLTNWLHCEDTVCGVQYMRYSNDIHAAYRLEVERAHRHR